MSVDSSPPVQPPQLSPDGQWVWDGTQWQPVAAAEPVHAGVFPSWTGTQVEAPDPTLQFAEHAAAPVQYQSPPAVDYSYQQADEPAVPLWQQPKGSNKSLFLYPIAGLAVLVVAMIILNSVGYVQLPFVGASSATPSQAPNPSPTPDFSGPESVRADRLFKSVDPVVASLENTIRPLNRYCATILSSGCFDAVSASDQQVLVVIAVFKNVDIPKCIEMPMKKVLADLQAMDAELKAARSGFQDNSTSAVGWAVQQFEVSYQKMRVDLLDVAQVKKIDCASVQLPSWVPE